MTPQQEKNKPQIEIDISEIKESQLRMEIALFGTVGDDQGGLVQKVNRHEKDIRNGKILGAIGVGCALGWQGLVDWIKNKI